MANSTLEETPPDGRIVTERKQRIFTIGIDRPRKLNGFTPKMVRELAQAYTAYEQDEDAWCALVHANGEHFTAGLQLDRFNIADELIPAGLVDPFGLRAPKRTKPVVVAVQGICLTIGIELMLGADIVVADENARFAQLEVRRGLMAFGGATIRMVERAGWGHAMRWLLTGDEFTARQALQAGFIQEVVESGTCYEHAFKVADTIARQAPLAVAATMRSAQRYADAGEAEAAASLREQIIALAETEDFTEGVASFVDRREARFKGR